ncbi:hypothetical protein [Ferrovibrio sp.]|uniref:hypothetical protein n=1 Tax=Ferrovibrio sp. TaxID=1917215 RepID=UPI0025B8A6D9|nr:hypothetical protein [Ferrovibrio sp.]MBX3455487.1 hypothetical protein [Ferrovibrio sp.]
MSSVRLDMAAVTGAAARLGHVMPWLRSLAVLCVLFLAAACAQVPKQAFNKEAHAGLKRIALFEPVKPDSYAVAVVHHPGNSFGLIGGLIAAAEIQSKSNGFTTKMRELQLDFAAYLTESVEQALVAANYEVVRFAPNRPENRVLNDYANIPVEADAYLDWAINWHGFLAATIHTDYMPSTRIYVRLVDAKSKAVLYSELIGYGFQYGAGEPVQLQAEPQHRFPTYGSLIDGAEQAAEALKAAAPLIGARISNDLRPSDFAPKDSGPKDARPDDMKISALGMDNHAYRNAYR